MGPYSRWAYELGGGVASDTSWYLFINKINFIFLAFVYHVPQFLAMHGTLMQFNCQPVEKKNHWQSQTFHHASQKGGNKSKYTIQVS